MRKIKFKGKSIHSDEWCFGSLVDYGDGDCEIQGFDVFHEGKDTWKELTVDYNTVCQFTGMYDADEKEIYEGDIVRTSIVEDAIGVVEWDNNQASFVVHMKGRTQCYPLSESNKIIGNIHDNKLEDFK